MLHMLNTDVFVLNVQGVINLLVRTNAHQQKLYSVMLDLVMWSNCDQNTCIQWQSYIRMVFNLVSNKVILHYYAVWLAKKLLTLFQPIRSKTKTNCVSTVFLCLAPITFICFEFQLVHFVVSLCCDCLVRGITLVLVLLHSVENCSNIKILFSCQCKEWGFLLREMFGNSLGTGDYGHLTVEHVPMLFRSHHSLHDLSNQGFEAAHKLQR